MTNRAELQTATEAMFDPKAKPVPLDPHIHIITGASGKIELAVSPPWLHTIYFGSAENRRLNAVVKVKEEEAKKAIDAGEWSALLFALAERPYRVDVFAGHARKMDDKTYWSLLGQVWIDCENVFQNLPRWRKLLTKKRPDRECIMHEDERDTLYSLPDPIPVYHGVDGSEFAWTTSEQVARWFANRFPQEGQPPRLRKGLAPKEHVIAYFDRRNEQEVLILREHVQDEVETVLEVTT